MSSFSSGARVRLAVVVAVVGGVGVISAAPASAAPIPLFSCHGQAATIVGTNGSDLIVGSAASDVIVARGGNDQVLARQGDDVVCGGAGADTLHGEGGGDLLAGEVDDDVIDGGPDFDTVSFARSPDGVEVRLDLGTASGEGADAIASTENIEGSELKDRLVGDFQRNLIHGGGGDDELAGLAAFDRLFGDAGIDAANGGADSDGCDAEFEVDCEV
jgi:Ca2+-binding RTX toxin-like protein